MAGDHAPAGAKNRPCIGLGDGHVNGLTNSRLRLFAGSAGRRQSLWAVDQVESALEFFDDGLVAGGLQALRVGEVETRQFQLAVHGNLIAHVTDALELGRVVVQLDDLDLAAKDVPRGDEVGVADVLALLK